MKKFLTFINPASGTKTDNNATLSFLQEHLSGISLHPFELNKHVTSSEIKGKINSDSWDGIIIGGGDGTVKVIGENLKGTSLPAVIIPMGSANGLATCLGIFDVNDTITAINQDKTINVDMLEVNGQGCFHLCDFGFNAGLIKRFHNEDERGMVSYFKASFRQFFDVRLYRFELKTKENQWETEAKMLVIANGDKFGTGAIINPLGKLNDGHMEVISLNPESFEDLAALSIHLFRGTLHESYLAEIRTVKDIEIGNPEGAEFHIDGEVMELTRKVKVTCNPRQVGFFTLRK